MKTLATLILMLLTIIATAQRGPLNTVYLKNGSVIKGTIIEDIEGVSIKYKLQINRYGFLINLRLRRS